MILHVDGDAFFAACEIAKDPSLRGKPVVVGKDRGIAAAMSYEAKALGVARGTPVFMIRKLWPQVIVLPSDYHAYLLYSKRMLEIVGRFTDRVQAYSIDECFADLAGWDKALGMSYEDIGLSIKETLKKELGITFSIGISTTKVLAKVASKNRKPDGFTIIHPDQIDRYLKTIPIGKVWGIGGATAIVCGKWGIKTAYDFAHQSEALVKERFAKPHVEIWHELRGVCIHGVSDRNGDDQKSFMSTGTFAPATSHYPTLTAELSGHIEEAALHMGRSGLYARGASFFMKRRDLSYRRSEVVFSRPLRAPDDIFAEIEPRFRKLHEAGMLYRATGLTLYNVISTDAFTPDLFGAAERAGRKEALFAEMMPLFKKGILGLASSLKKADIAKEAPQRPHKRALPRFRIPFLRKIR